MKTRDSYEHEITCDLPKSIIYNYPSAATMNKVTLKC